MKKVLLLSVLFIIIINSVNSIEIELTHNEVFDGSTSTTIKAGINITVDKQINITKIKKFNVSTATKCYLYNSAGTQLSSGNYSSYICNLTPSVLLSVDNIYYISNDKSGASYTYGRKTNPNYPYDLDSYATINHGTYYSGGWKKDSTLIYEIESIYINYPLNLIYPAENKINNTWNGTILIYSTVNVTINDTRFEYISYLNNVVQFHYENIINGNYSILINNSISTIEFWHELSGAPTINKGGLLYEYPITTNEIILNANTIDNDQSGLYWANLTCRNSTGGLLYSNYSGIITGQNRYNWTGTINISSLQLSENNWCYFVSTDPHTLHEIPEFLETKSIIQEKLSYRIPLKQDIKNISSPTIKEIDYNINLISADTELRTIETNKLKDRYSFTFNFNNKEAKFYRYKFRITSDQKLIYIKDDNFKAWLVSKPNEKGGFWSDLNFKNDKNAKYTVTKIDDYTYEITILTTAITLDFNSVGILNTATYNHTFNIVSPTVGGGGSGSSNYVFDENGVLIINTDAIDFWDAFLRWSEEPLNEKKFNDLMYFLQYGNGNQYQDSTVEKITEEQVKQDWNNVQKHFTIDNLYTAIQNTISYFLVGQNLNTVGVINE